MQIRKLVTVLEETRQEMGQSIDPPTRKAAAIAVIANPCAGRYVEDLTELMDIGAELGGLEITVRDVLNLSKGDIIKLENTKVGDEMELKIGTMKKFYARPGVVGNHLAVQITRRIESYKNETNLFDEFEGGEL